MKGAAPLLFALLAGACVTPEKEPMFQPAFEPFDASDPSWRVTRPLLLVADCQLFNVLSEPVPDRNLSAQTLVPTAIRSPQLNLFTPEVLEWILSNSASDAQAILHLGDALDLACEGELDRFLEIMATTELPWLVAPGNHDCYYFGNFDPVRMGAWRDACHAAGEPLTKDRFVRRYVAALLRQEDVGFQALARDLGVPDARERTLDELEPLVPDRFSWRAPEDAGAFLTRIEWNVDHEQHWRSYILQLADVGGGPGEARAQALLLDSCQYEHRPVVLPNAWRSLPLPLNTGLTGEMLPDQLRSVRAWMDELQARGESSLLVSHHPVSSYAAKSRAALTWLLTRYPAVNLALTAHTHAGHYAYHPLPGDRELVELNVGSTTDWPMEWRTFQAFYDPARAHGENLYLQSRRFTLAAELRNRPGFFQSGWEVPFGELDDYRAFRQGVASTASITDIYLSHHLKPFFFGPADVEPRAGAFETEARYKDTLLSTYARLLREFPTAADDAGARWPAGCASDAEVLAQVAARAGKGVAIESKIELCRELDAFERSRRSVDPDTGAPTDERRLAFKLSQAVWASRYGKTRGRTLQPEDELVRVRIPQSLRGAPPQPPAPR